MEYVGVAAFDVSSIGVASKAVSNVDIFSGKSELRECRMSGRPGEVNIYNFLGDIMAPTWFPLED